SFTFFLSCFADPPHLHSFPTRRSSDLGVEWRDDSAACRGTIGSADHTVRACRRYSRRDAGGGHDRTQEDHHSRYGWHQQRRRERSEEHTSELQSRGHLVCRLLLEKKKK